MKVSVRELGDLLKMLEATGTMPLCPATHDRCDSDCGHRGQAASSGEWVEHRFSGALSKALNFPALAAEVIVAIPYRGITTGSTYFATAGTFNKANLLQSDRMSELFCSMLFQYRDAGKLKLHAFVLMPNHIHLLLSVPQGLTLERVMQLVKGGFSYEAGKRFGICGPIWQKSFLDRRVRDASECMKYRDYIHQNPARAGLIDRAEAFAYSSMNPCFRLDELPQRLKPATVSPLSCTAEAVLHPNGGT